MGQLRLAYAREFRALPVAEKVTVIGVILALFVMQFVDTRHGLWTPWTVSIQLVVCAVATVCLGPAAWRRRHTMSRTGWIFVAEIAVIIMWSLVSSMLAPQAIVWRTTVPRIHQVMPPITALVTMTAALETVLVLSGEGRRLAVLGGASGVLLGAVMDWPVQAAIHRSPRLASAMGGSAVLHVAVILAAGVFLDGSRTACSKGRRLFFATVGCGALVMAIATGSRAALIVVAIFGAWTLVAWGRQHPRFVGGLAAAMAIALISLIASVPALRRLATWTSPARLHAAEVGWGAVSSSWTYLLLGVGSGRIFPWYAIEDKFIAAPGAGIIGTPFGTALNSAHSVFVLVASELGVLMFLVLCAAIVVLWGNAWRGVRSRSAWAVTSMALAATTVAWGFDTYLLKNFAVSTWWWLVAGSVLASGGEYLGRYRQRLGLIPVSDGYLAG
ncbi:O-antigen ligase family protein [Cutibacterium porci]|uniref:O-antigen ligase family protein n=1 Tax=Cutibacterium porci TaxID=2605781 RepID=UPI002DDA220D|nr:hypothetical protein [Cutibacterium porci]